MGEKERVPLVEGLYGYSPQGASLLATHCLSCGAYYFPKSLSCRNAKCVEKNVEEVRLSRQGTVYTYTVQRYVPPRPFRIDPAGPYAIAAVELAEGIRVIGLMTGCSPDDVRIGMPVETVVERLYTDDDDRDILLYMFRPVKTAEDL